MDDLIPLRATNYWKRWCGDRRKCPVTPPAGSRVRCDLDFRIPSNAGLGVGTAQLTPNLEPFRQSEIYRRCGARVKGGYLFSGRYTHKPVDPGRGGHRILESDGKRSFPHRNPGQGLAAEVGTGFVFIPLAQNASTTP